MGTTDNAIKERKRRDFTTRNKRLASALAATGLSQGEIARRAGINERTLSSLKNRRTRATMETTLRIADALGMQLDELFDDCDWIKS